MFKSLAFLTSLAFFGMLTACADPQPPTSEDIQNQNQEQANLQAVQSVGFPAIKHYSEKRQLRMIYELRDEAIATKTYQESAYTGHITFLCNSVGYGIPYATQYTNPQQINYNGSSYGGNVVIPQADPNGLYSPGEADATWVLCLNPKNKKVSVVYSEPKIVVVPDDFTPPNVSK